MGENHMRDGTWRNQVDNSRMTKLAEAAAMIELT